MIVNEHQVMNKRRAPPTCRLASIANFQQVQHEIAIHRTGTGGPLARVTPSHRKQKASKQHKPPIEAWVGLLVNHGQTALSSSTGWDNPTSCVTLLAAKPLRKQSREDPFLSEGDPPSAPCGRGEQEPQTTQVSPPTSPPPPSPLPPLRHPTLQGCSVF